MKLNLKFLYVIGALLTLVSCHQEAAHEEQAEKKPGLNKYIEDWRSLKKINRQPEWFKDAKLGIYFHWGIYSVPAHNSEWYPRWMYHKDLNDHWGAKVHAYHVKNFGSLDEFNYHDFIPLFDGAEFDAKKWAGLFELAGAKFAGPVAIHHDGFAMWDSEVNPWNVAKMGPKRDITQLLLQELKARGLKTITTFHHARLLQRYVDQPNEWAGQGDGDLGWDSHYPYHPDLITSTQDPDLRKFYGNLPEEEFLDYWLAQVTEVVDQYSPDIIWFDSWLDKIPDAYRRKMVAHHFNHAESQGQEPLVAYKQDDLPSDVGILDIEQGGKTDISEDYWLTDVTISHGSWCYTHDMGYKAPSLVVRNMIDVWSKKGIVLLNVSPRADGVIPDEQQEILATIGKWIRKHEAAVYKTRAHSVYGYGAADITEGHFGGQSAAIEYSNKDIRFSRSQDGKSIFIYILGMPQENTTLKIKHVKSASDMSAIKNVSLIGSKKKINWSINSNGDLIVKTLGSSDMDEIATVFKVDI